MDAREPLREWIRAICRRLEITPTELARRIGTAPSTMTRFLNDENAGMLRGSTISRIAELPDVPPPPIGQPQSGFAERDAQPLDGPPRRIQAAIEALGVGRPGVDAWQIHTAALALAGILPGDIAVTDMHAEPVEGDVVIAQDYKWSTGQAHSVWRLYTPPYLVCAATSHTPTKPMLVDHDRVVIKAVVTAVLRVRDQ